MQKHTQSKRVLVTDVLFWVLATHLSLGTDPGEKDIFIISDGYEDWRMPKKEYHWKAWFYTEQLCAETFEHTFNPVLRHQPSQIQQRRFQA